MHPYVSFFFQTLLIKSPSERETVALNDRYHHTNPIRNKSRERSVRSGINGEFLGLPANLVDFVFLYFYRFIFARFRWRSEP